MKEGVSFWYMTALMAMLCIGAGMHLLPGTNVPGFGQAAVKFGSEQATAGLSEANRGSFSEAEGMVRRKVTEVAFDETLSAEEALERIAVLLRSSSSSSTVSDGGHSISSSSSSSSIEQANQKEAALAVGNHIKSPPAVHAEITAAPAAADVSAAVVANAAAASAQHLQTMPTAAGFRELPGGPKKPQVAAGAPAWCTPDQMQSIHGFKQMNESAVQLVSRRYNKGCAAIRHNYKCGATPEYKKYLADDTLRLVPKLAAEGKCSLFGNEGKYPFPDNSRILFWGNSHLRELITAIICQFPDAKPEVIGTDQDNVCNPSKYKLEKDRSEIMWRAKYGNNVTVFGLCNCGLMYDPPNVFANLKGMLELHPHQLTHVVANPANVAGWAIKIKYKSCVDEPWHKVLVNRSNRELYEWNPFPQPTDLRHELEEHGFGGKIVWTLPFWCKNRSQANIYRRPAPLGLLDAGVADGFLDTSEYICPEKMYHHRCQVSSCSKSAMGQHQCLPGPPDDMAAALMHIIHTV